MKRHINLRALIGVAVVVGVAAVGIYFLHGFQSRRGAGGLLTRAIRAQGEGQRDQAEQLLRRYLSFAPNDVDALARLGKMLAEEPAVRTPDGRDRAIEVLERVIQRDASQVEARRRLIQLLSAGDKHDEAIIQLVALLRDHPEGELELELGRHQEAINAFAQAAESYGRARTRSPGLVEAYTRQANLLRGRLRRPGDADKVMDAVASKDGLIARNPKSPAAYLARAAYRRGAKLDGANADVAHALELAPDDAEALMAAATDAAGADKLEEARKFYARGIERHPRDRRFPLELGTLEARSGRVDAAIDAFRRGVAEHPDDLTQSWSLASLLAETGHGDEATPLISRLRKRPGVRPEPLDFLDARILIGRGEWAPARVILARVAPILGSQVEQAELAKRAFLLLGECETRFGDPDQQYQAYRRAIEINLPDDGLYAPAHLGLGGALAALGRVDDAIAEYRAVADRPGSPPEARVELARLLVYRAVRQPAARRDWGPVDRAIDEAERSAPGLAVPVAILRAESLDARGASDRAEAGLREATARFPDRIELTAALAALADRRGRNADALALLDEAGRRLGDRVEVRLARIGHWAFVGGDAANAALDALARDLSKFPPEDSRRIRSALADAEARLGRFERAAALRDELAREQPDDLPARLAQHDAAIRVGDEARTTVAIAEIRRIEGPEGTFWRYAQAQQIIRRARRDPSTPTEPALTLLREAAQRRPNWSRVVESEAALAELRRDEGTALASYLRAVELGDRSPETIRRAARLLHRRGRFLQADALLRQVEGETSQDGSLQRLASDLSIRKGEFRKALDLAREAARQPRPDPIDLLWLARAASAFAREEAARGRTDEATRARSEAEGALNQAVAAAPAEVAPRIALIQFLVENGRADRAREEAEKARQALTGDGAVLGLAQCFELAGNPADAEAIYKKAQADRPGDREVAFAMTSFLLRQGRTAEAEALLRRAIAARGQGAPESGWARQMLALVLAAGGDPARSRAALDVIGLAQDGSPAVPPGQSAAEVRVQARILATQGDRARRRQAIRLLESLAARDELSGDDAFLLARLQEADGDWPASRRTMQKLLGEDPRNAGYILAYVRSLLGRRMVDEAESWIVALESLRPGDPATIEARARSLALRGQGPKAIPAILGQLKGDDPARILWAARLLEAIGQEADAEAMYRHLDGKPGGDIELILFLGRRGRAAEAIERAERSWAAARSPGEAEALTSASVTALYGGSPDAELIRKVEARIGAAAKANPKSPTIRFDQANLWLLTGRYDQAESMFRGIHEADRRDVGPLNNLAWLRALLGSPAEALELVNRAIALGGPIPALLDTRGLAQLAGGKLNEAIADFEEAAPHDESGAIRYHLAAAYRRAGRREDADRALREAKAQGFSPSGTHPLERALFGDFPADKRAAPPGQPQGR